MRATLAPRPKGGEYFFNLLVVGFTNNDNTDDGEGHDDKGAVVKVAFRLQGFGHLADKGTAGKNVKETWGRRTWYSNINKIINLCLLILVICCHFVVGVGEI